MGILLTCSNEHPGVRTHLLRLKNILLSEAAFESIENLIYFLPDYRKMGRNAPRIRGLLRRMAKLKISRKMLDYGDNIIIGSWKPYYRQIIDQLNKRGVKPSILWCSTLGQTEMTWMIELVPFNAILDMLGRGKIKHLFVPERTFESISHVKNVKYLPHPIDMSISWKATNGIELNGNNIDLFLQARPGKNVLQQMIAQRFAHARYTLHTNIKNHEIIEVAKKLKLSFTQHDWLPENHYYDLISKMDLSLQVTWTESFNYAVCERFLLGVPALVSRELFWVSREKLLKKYLVVEDCDSPREIAKRIDFLLNNRNLHGQIISKAREILGIMAKEYNRIILEQVRDCF
jgi:glycosyltransferase involved in cell wall biosynthesis